MTPLWQALARKSHKKAVVPYNFQRLPIEHDYEHEQEHDYGETVAGAVL